MDTGYAAAALNNLELYREIIHHREQITFIRGIDYTLHEPKHLSPVPPPELRAAWGKDYQIMQEQMIYGATLSFDKLINRIKELQTKINQLEG